MKKLLCMLTMAGLMTLGLSGLALADAPAADTYKSAKKGINYPAYLYAKSWKGQRDYAKYVKPAKGYNFELVPQAAKYHVSEW